MKTKLFERLNKHLMNQQFRQINNVVWDLTSNKMGILTDEDCIATLETNTKLNETDYSVSLNPLAVMSMAVPAYAQKTPSGNIKSGDVIVDSKGDAYGWVTEVESGGKIVVLKIDGSEQKITPPTVNVIGFGEQSGLMVVKPLFDITGGNSESFKNMFQLMMLSSEDGLDEDNMDKMMQIMLMMSASSSNNENNMMQNLLFMKMLSKNF